MVIIKEATRKLSTQRYSLRTYNRRLSFFPAPTFQLEPILQASQNLFLDTNPVSLSHWAAFSPALLYKMLSSFWNLSSNTQNGDIPPLQNLP